MTIPICVFRAEKKSPLKRALTMRMAIDDRSCVPFCCLSFVLPPTQIIII